MIEINLEWKILKHCASYQNWYPIFSSVNRSITSYIYGFPTIYGYKSWAFLLCFEGVVNNILIQKLEIENVILRKVKQYVKMKSHEERLHKLIIERKIGDTKDLMQCVSNEINNNNFFCYYLWKDARDLFIHSYQISTLANG